VRRALALTCATLVVCASPVDGQTVRFGVHGVTVTHSEVDESLKANGLGVGGLLGLRLGRFAFEARGYWADLDPDRPDNTAFEVVQVDGRVSVLFARSIAVEVGAGRRWIDPDFATQEVGLVRVGILSEYPLSRIATVWGRGAYLVAPQFSGGGAAGLAVELSLGTSIGTPNGRIRAMGEFEFQRFDREVQRRAVPLQVTVARFGVEMGWE
jgi:hypothetical protein